MMWVVWVFSECVGIECKPCQIIQMSLGLAQQLQRVLVEVVHDMVGRVLSWAWGARASPKALLVTASGMPSKEFKASRH